MASVQEFNCHTVYSGVLKIPWHLLLQEFSFNSVSYFKIQYLSHILI
jgi:hypothetical protein